ncbi:MAG: thermonuclease family protein [Kiritimatiellia bacterium]|nr:thermonuclease family protein [Kiritimatiellia bacterium]MDP6629905.1 thermonuclease family protein [Kiritimatiellia bacterium]MDP7022840.1 thermonuclease family protein [Kiritimatiellia bacterium]
MSTNPIRVLYRVCLMAMAAVMMVPTCGSAAGQWYRYDDCTLITQHFNDGDSFHVRCGRRHYIFRLYFVDTPETELSFPDRVEEQAKYWGLTPKQTIRLGQDATAFTTNYLSKPFTVHTRRVDARGRSDRTRYFGMIETEEGFLSIALVRNGLARVYGLPITLPDGKPASKHWSRLSVAQKAAKREKLGGWASQPSEPKPLTPIAPQDYIVRARLPVFDPERHARLVGVLKRGAKIRILGAETDRLLRIQFGSGETLREGLCRRSSIVLPARTKEPSEQ